jgi:septal ring factor EnvC (AmiA/AmiB activator)
MATKKKTDPRDDAAFRAVQSAWRSAKTEISNLEGTLHSTNRKARSERAMIVNAKKRLEDLEKHAMEQGWVLEEPVVNHFNVSPSISGLAVGKNGN